MPKSMISLTLSEETLERIDREVRRLPGGSRSAVIEAWLRRGARARAADRLREETVASYESLSPEERAEGEAISRASGETARRLTHDE